MRMVPVICPAAGLPAGSRSAPRSGSGYFAIPGTLNTIVQGDPVQLWNYFAVAVGSGGKTGAAYWWAGKWVLASWEC
jgi:hypothetical protein